MIKRRNKYFAFFVLFVLLFSLLSVWSFAENVSLYGSVNDQTSQVITLMGFLPNESNFKLGMDYLVCRLSDYQYRLYYADDFSSNPVYYIDYSRYNTSGYNFEWRISRGTTSNINIIDNNYTFVSNTQGGIFRPVESYFSDKYIVWLLPVLAVAIVFYVFKPSRGGVRL